MIVLATAILPVVFGEKPSAISDFHCAAERQSICFDDAPCHSVTVPSWSNGYPRRGIYEVCDKSGCQRLQSRFTRDGAYLIVKTDGRSGEMGGRVAFAKIAPDGRFVEVTDLLTTIVVAHGRCTPVG